MVSECRNVTATPSELSLEGLLQSRHTKPPLSDSAREECTKQTSACHVVLLCPPPSPSLPPDIKHSCFILAPAGGGGRDGRTQRRVPEGIIAADSWIPGLMQRYQKSASCSLITDAFIQSASWKSLPLFVCFLIKGTVRKRIRATFHSSDFFLRPLSALTLTAAYITPPAPPPPTARNRSAGNSAAVSDSEECWIFVAWQHYKVDKRPSSLIFILFYFLCARRLFAKTAVPVNEVSSLC